MHQKIYYLEQHKLRFFEQLKVRPSFNLAQPYNQNNAMFSFSCFVVANEYVLMNGNFSFVVNLC